MKDLTDDLLPLVPFLKEWSISHDIERGEKIEHASRDARQALIATVIPRLLAINAYLDSCGLRPTEGACWLDALAEAAIEAEMFERG